MKTRIAALLLTILFLICLFPGSVYARSEKAVNPFSDIEEDDRFYGAIMWAYTNDITIGKTATTFQPGGHCTRAQAVTFLWRAAGKPNPSSLANPFTDVAPDAYYFRAVMWAVEKGITSGKTPTTFLPDQPVLRKEFVTFLWRSAGKPEPQTGSPFADAGKTDTYYYPAVVWACENGITAGTGNGLFGVNNVCTRAQTVMFLYRYWEDKPVTEPMYILVREPQLLSLSQPAQLEATVLPLCAKNRTVTWSSDDTAVATVSQNGLVTPVAEGTAAITARCGSASTQCPVLCQTRNNLPAAPEPLLQNARTDAVKKLLGNGPEGTLISKAYLSEKGYLSSVPGKALYYVMSYPVKAGVTYRIHGRGVRLNTTNVSAAVFSTSCTPGSGGRGPQDRILIGPGNNLSKAADYDMPFTPTAGGFLLIAHCVGVPGLEVQPVGRSDIPKPAVTVQVFGDSMSDNTWGDKRTWVDLLPGLLPEYNVTLRNRAIAGNTLTKFLHEDGTLGGVAHQILSSPSQLDPNADLIIIWAGSNDWTSIFSLGSPGNGDSTTVYGAVENIIRYVSKNSHAQLLFITPLQRNSVSDRLYRTETDMYGNRLNSRSYTLEQFSEAIREVCAGYGIPCLDLYHTSPINKDNIAVKYSEDGLHVNEAGEKLLAAQIAGMILHPAPAPAPVSQTPAYNLSTYTDEFKHTLFEPMAVGGPHVWLNKNHAGIRHAFSKGPVTLSYKVTLNGATHAVTSTATATYDAKRDVWHFADTLSVTGQTVCVVMEFGSYGMEAWAYKP